MSITKEMFEEMFNKYRTSETSFEEDKKEIKRVQKIISQLVKETNYMGTDSLVYWGVILELNRTHRTLQQNIMRIVVRAIVDFFAYEYEKRFYDARNEESCKIGAEMKKIMDKHNFPFI